MNTPDFNTANLFNVAHVNITLLSDADCKVLVDGKDFCTLSEDIPINKEFDNIDHVFTFIHKKSGIVVNYDFHCTLTPAPNKIIKANLMNDIIRAEKKRIQEKNEAKKKREEWWIENGDSVIGLFFIVMCLLFIASLVFIVIGWFNDGHKPVWTYSFWGSLVLGLIAYIYLQW